MGDLSTSQAADQLGLTVDTVSKYAKQGLFPTAYKLGAGGPWRIPEPDLEAFRRAMRPSMRPRDVYALEPASRRAAAARKAAATRARRGPVARGQEKA